MNEKEFLKQYDASKYEHPSVAIDVVILCLDRCFGLNVLCTRRTSMPFKGMLQLPGGFIDINKNLDDQVKELVYSKTGFTNHNLKFEQLYTYGKVNRDPRTRVISVTYFAILPQNTLYISEPIRAEDSNYGWMKISYFNNYSMAFDHNYILSDAIHRIANKISYTDIALDFLRDKNNFTIYEVQKVYEAFLNKKLNAANFRRDFLNRFVKTKKAVETGDTSTEYSKRASKCYKIK